MMRWACVLLTCVALTATGCRSNKKADCGDCSKCPTKCPSKAAEATTAKADAGCAKLCTKTLAASGYKAFGAPIEATEVMSLASVVDHLDEYEGKQVCVKADIKEVCKARGCWMMLSDAGHDVRVKFTRSASCAEGFFVPRNANGHEAYVVGELKRGTMPEEVARHYAKDAGASPEEIARIVGPQPAILMLATGVMISDGATLDPPVTG